ncbi:MAG: hypothetical protein ACR2HO_04745 [Rubrobacteraceae bacterium]
MFEAGADEFEELLVGDLQVVGDSFRREASGHGLKQVVAGGRDHF